MAELHISELLDLEYLEVAIEAGFVRVQTHPTEPLVIYNYSEKAQYEGEWNGATLTCRGLIVDAKGWVKARPLRKFFNFGDPMAGELDASAKAVVVDKLDGCFPRGTTLNLWGGGTITIDKVVTQRLPVTLVGMDEQGNLVPALVTDWHHNGRKDHWLDIEVDCQVSRLSGGGGGSKRLRATVNHHIWVNGEYRPACEIQPGDTVITQTWRPSNEVIRMVRASLLGDGCIVQSTTKPGQAKYQESHSEKQADYAESLRKTLGNCAANRADTQSGYGSRMIWAGSREYEALGDLRREWYPDGVKVIPADLSWIDDYAVAKWLMDDGYRQKLKAQADRISFATNSFTEDDVRRLGERLSEMYGVSYHLVKDRGWVLIVNSGRRQQIQVMWQAIALHIHPSMRYKVPEQYQDVPYIEPESGREITAPRETKVLSVTPVEPIERNFPSGRTGFDVTTTTHNYMARGVLVHNSLGILYPASTGWAIATRGSFASDQALHATEVLRWRYPDFTPPEGVTVLWEIIYPENRIVCDYGGADDLFLLGGVEIATGRVLSPDEVPGWPGPSATVFTMPTLADALAMPPRPGAEGIVVRMVATGQMVKLKQEAYVRAHAVVTRTSTRTIWQALANGEGLKFIEDFIPDEFFAWANQVSTDLQSAKDAWVAAARAEFERMPKGVDRKTFAEAALKSPYRAALFRLLDEREIDDMAWKAVQPAYERPYQSIQEEVA